MCRLHSDEPSQMNLTEVLSPVESSTPLKIRKVVLWGEADLFMDSVELFLNKAGWQVTKLLSECDLEGFIQQVQFVKPDVVILCQETDAERPGILIKLSQVQSCSKVVVLNLENNFVHVFGRQHVLVQGVSDLLSVIEHDYLSSDPCEEVHPNT